VRLEAHIRDLEQDLDVLHELDEAGGPALREHALRSVAERERRVQDSLAACEKLVSDPGDVEGLSSRFELVRLGSRLVRSPGLDEWKRDALPVVWAQRHGTWVAHALASCWNRGQHRQAAAVQHIEQALRLFQSRLVRHPADEAGLAREVRLYLELDRIVLLAAHATEEKGASASGELAESSMRACLDDLQRHPGMSAALAEKLECGLRATVGVTVRRVQDLVEAAPYAEDDAPQPGDHGAGPIAEKRIRQSLDAAVDRFARYVPRIFALRSPSWSLYHLLHQGVWLQDRAVRRDVTRLVAGLDEVMVALDRTYPQEWTIEFLMANLDLERARREENTTRSNELGERGWRRLLEARKRLANETFWTHRPRPPYATEAMLWILEQIMVKGTTRARIATTREVAGEVRLLLSRQCAASRRDGGDGHRESREKLGALLERTEKRLKGR
jgi:hypothetical protein